MPRFEKISLKPSHCVFNDIEHVNLNFLHINKKRNICIFNRCIFNNQNINNQNINNELPLCFSFSSVDT